MAIHPTAIISKEAKIDPSTEIGPYVIIEGNAHIGKNNRIMSHAFIGRNSTIGDGNEIHMGAVVGHDPQDRAFKGDDTFLVVGNHNIIREHASIHRGSLQDSKTVIGNNCLIMGSTHIAHDCKVGNNVIMANMAGMAGYVEVEDQAILSGGAMVHQFVKIGRLSIVSGNSRIGMDVPPFMTAAERNQLWGVNVIGLKRAKFATEIIQELRQLYKIFFIETKGTRSKILQIVKEHPFKSDEVKEFIKFVENSKRGICPGRQKEKEFE